MVIMIMAEPCKKLTEDFEIEQHIRALGASSSRVRFTMLTLVITCVAALVTLWSERPDAWAKDRLQKSAHYKLIADLCGLWYDPSCKENCDEQVIKVDDPQKRDALLKRLATVKFKKLPQCNEEGMGMAVQWLSAYGLKTKE